ncbi:bacillithiol system redox-active protein YtxJ [Polaribacter gangjinensis]|uniref:Cytosolic protein n=1 Tax=Polaribacter gangjinensis TaxID=574710 RepID=A0A2S7WB24_9FLAO|nr:bacillithiol system redox-active protein YtxJ [Polaribacter gangjinensis]PQJ74461.1 cytosolic protein [Polaribacter gangjinensis]
MSLYDRLFGNAAPHKDTKNSPNWIPLTTENQLEEIKNSSKNKSVVIFKHSTSCGISNMVIKRFEKLFTEEHQSMEVYYLDLLNYRSISNEISRIFEVVHESPQVLVIKNEVSVFDASHYDILEINLSRFL